MLLHFTRARLITIYDNVLLQFTIAWLLQHDTERTQNSAGLTIVAIDSCFTQLLQFTTCRYCDLRRLLLQFTTGITVHDIITIHDRTVCVECYSGKKYSSGSIKTVLNYLHILLGNNILLLI